MPHPWYQYMCLGQILFLAAAISFQGAKSRQESLFKVIYRIWHFAAQYLTTMSDTDKAWYKVSLMCGSFSCFSFISAYFLVNYHLHLGTANKWIMRLFRHLQTDICKADFRSISCLFIILVYDRSRYYIIFDSQTLLQRRDPLDSY